VDGSLIRIYMLHLLFLDLSSSLGELIITIITAAASAWFFFTRNILVNETKGIAARIGSSFGRIGSIIFVCIISMLILWLFRGFSEAVRSFVLDSTIRYSNPSEILPDGAAALMYLIA